LSNGIEKYLEYKNLPVIKDNNGYYLIDGKEFFASRLYLTDPILIKIIQELGDRANGDGTI